jgi:hypothetical protein
MTIIGTRTITVVVALTALEFSLRTFAALGHWSSSEQSARYGWRMLPNQEALSRDLTVPEHINAEGFRDREWDPPQPAPGAPAQPAPSIPAAPITTGPWIKDESVFRVALVGNSMTFGTSVAIEDTWSRQLEDALAQDFAARGVKRKPLVMNFAVQGYVFEQMARVYEDIIRPYRPDLLIVPTHPHDITPMRPSRDDPDYEFRRWILRSATFEWLNRHVINRWMPPPPSPPELVRQGQIAQAADDAITYSPFSKENRKYWEDMKRRMDGVRQEVEADGGHLVIATLPRWRAMFEPGLTGADTVWVPWVKQHPGTVHLDPVPDFRPPMAALVQEFREKTPPKPGPGDLNWKDELGRDHPGWELDHAKESLFLLDDRGHYSVKGHALLGQVLFRELSPSGLLPKP